jgi:hypothetical protein
MPEAPKEHIAVRLSDFFVDYNDPGVAERMNHRCLELLVVHDLRVKICLKFLRAITPPPPPTLQEAKKLSSPIVQ